jgi:EF hand
MSITPTTVLVFTLVFGGAMVLAGGARAAPRPGDDGQVSAATGALVAPRAAVALPARRAALADPDLDGVVSHAEAARYYEALFSLIDRDRDGRVSGHEFLRSAVIDFVHTLRRTWATPFAFDAGEGNGALAPEEFLKSNGWRRGWSNRAGAAEHRQATFNLLDADRDAVLSRWEFIDGGTEQFAASDADRDGKVTIREFYGGKRL